MGLNAFQSPMHEWGREKIVIGKNTCCNLSLLSCFPHCPGAHCHFVSITRKDPAGAIDSREHPSIQLNKQREGKGRQSITVAPLNGWVYWLTYVFSCCQAREVLWGPKATDRPRGKLTVSKLSKDSTVTWEVGLRLWHSNCHCGLQWPLESPGHVTAVTNCPELSNKRGSHFIRHGYLLLGKPARWKPFLLPRLTTRRMKRNCSVH